MNRLRLASVLALALLAVPAAAQPVSDLNVYLGPDGAAYWDAQCQYRLLERRDHVCRILEVWRR